MSLHRLLLCSLLPAAVGVVTAEKWVDQERTVCATAEHRHFDFWVGEWKVVDASGAPIGESRVDTIMNACAITEHWRPRGGPEGRSISVYDGLNGGWHQTYVDGSGGLLHLSGGWTGTAMQMQGTRRSRDGRDRMHRITWTPQTDGAVIQLYEGSEDDGATWQVLFEGHYVPVDPAM